MLHIINRCIISLIRCSILIRIVTKNLLSYLLCLVLRMSGITRYDMAFTTLGYKSLSNMRILYRDQFPFQSRNHPPMYAIQD